MGAAFGKLKAKSKTAKVAAAIVTLVAVVAIVGWLMTRRSGNEDWAIQTLRTINGAQVGYFERCDAYAPNLLELKRGGDLPSLDLTAAGTIADSGYLVTLAPSATAAVVSNGASECGEAVTDYFAHADPLRAGRAASRHFATDSGGTIFHDSETIANPIPSTASPVR